jgi:MraZ protein
MKFQGNSQVTIDGNGRVSFPSYFRSLVPSEKKFYLSIGTNHTIHLRREQDYELWAETLKDLPKTSESFALRRKILHNTHEVILDDKQHRFLLPPSLKEYAGIDKEVVFSGDGDKVVLMNPEKAKLYALSASDDFGGAEWIL